MESTPDYLPSPLRRNVYAGLLTAACVTKIRLMAGARQGWLSFQLTDESAVF